MLASLNNRGDFTLVFPSGKRGSRDKLVQRTGCQDGSWDFTWRQMLLHRKAKGKHKVWLLTTCEYANTCLFVCLFECSSRSGSNLRLMCPCLTVYPAFNIRQAGVCMCFSASGILLMFAQWQMINWWSIIVPNYYFFWSTNQLIN